jgi:hypothetical protein
VGSLLWLHADERPGFPARPRPPSQGLLVEADEAARASRQREDAARAQGREFADRARRAETLCEEAEAELVQVGRGGTWRGVLG